MTTVKESAAYTAPCGACGGALHVFTNLYGVLCEACDRCGTSRAVPRVVGTAPDRAGQPAGPPCAVCGERVPTSRRQRRVRRTCSVPCTNALRAEVARRTAQAERERRRAAELPPMTLVDRARPVARICARPLCGARIKRGPEAQFCSTGCAVAMKRERRAAQRRAA